MRLATPFSRFLGTRIIQINKRRTPDKAKRIIDFLSGTLYAINGTLQKLGSGIFLCTPNNVSVEGKMTNEEDKKVESENKTKKNIDDYEW